MGKKIAGKMPRRARPRRAEQAPPAGLPLFLVAVVESAAFAQMSERDAIMLMVRLWYGDDVARLLELRVARTGEGKRAPKRLLDIMGNGYYWDAVHGRVRRNETWVEEDNEQLPTEEN